MRPTERFSQTVADYLRYRPSYPQEVLQVMVKDCGLKPDAVIADVGSGTGFLARLFLEHANIVYGVEPNPEMRIAGEHYLQAYPGFISVNGTAEATTLPNESVDFVTVGTAFHWFDAEKTKLEFQRILKVPGWVMLVWNVRDEQASSLVREYDRLIMQFCSDYNERAQRFDKSATAAFFAPFEMKEKNVRFSQWFDWEGFKGRLLSSSYSLRDGDARYEDMLQALKDVFDRHQINGQVEFIYRTHMCYGRLR